MEEQKKEIERLRKLVESKDMIIDEINDELNLVKTNYANMQKKIKNAYGNRKV